MAKKFADEKTKLHEKCLAELKEIEKEKRIINKVSITKLTREFKQTCDTQKRETQRLDQTINSKRRAGTTRSGTIRGAIKQSTHSSGRWVNAGIDHSLEPYEEDEQEFLKKAITKIKKVNELKFEHLKYLVMYVYIKDLRNIKNGKQNSYFHKRYTELVDQGRATTELFSEMCHSLFTNEQRDYINGLLYGAFNTITKDEKGDIRYKEINYVNVVMVAEITVRIVKHIHKLSSIDEALAYMKESARESLGLGPDEDEDED